jgi:hypothetical protein
MGHQSGGLKTIIINSRLVMSLFFSFSFNSELRKNSHLVNSDFSPDYNANCYSDTNANTYYDTDAKCSVNRMDKANCASHPDRS